MTEERISVSRDALRADLAEMELRISRRIDEAMRGKADAIQVAEIALKLDRIDRGEFTTVHQRALAAFIEDQLDDRADKGWTQRDRWLGVLGFVGSLAMLILSLAIATHGGGL